jgi:hypothetical protein
MGVDECKSAGRDLQEGHGGDLEMAVARAPIDDIQYSMGRHDSDTASE